MAGTEPRITIVSTKGRVILPSAIRKARKWRAGTRLTIEETAEGVLLKPAPAFAATRPEDVFGVLAYRGKPKSLDEMHASVRAEARRRHDHCEAIVTFDRKLVKATKAAGHAGCKKLRRMG